MIEMAQRLAVRAGELDRADPLAHFRAAFIDVEGVVAYLDGNSLGRPLHATREAMTAFVSGPWASGLIRSWDDGWMDAPTQLGDLLGRVVLGAGAGQTVVADSTTVMLYKLARAAVAARPGRDEIVADTENFPTDRFIVEGIAAERSLTVRWISPDPKAGVTTDQIREVVGPQTALVLLSHIAYRSGYVADLPAITALAQDAGALILWDLCHSAGCIELALDEHKVDLAVGCTYKYLNGGPGSPAFGYIARRLQDELYQPIQGWMGSAEPFEMGEHYEPAAGIRRFISGTPPIVGMLAMRDMLALIERAGMPALRIKSVALTSLAIEIADELLAPLGVQLASPRDPAVRGGHVTLDHPDFKRVNERLWARGVIPDFRPPHGLRIGASPLSTSFAELALGLATVAELLTDTHS